ncbi:MAG: hypothetical protein QOD88_1963 [Mycobacterium sp.]|jgi:hypothetical protein|nr:hypothetical protein [Mycobacterium sp.]
MNIPDWVKFLVSLLAIILTVLTAPVTAGRWRLAKLNRLISALDKLDAADPARPYLAADVRRASAWWATTTTIRFTWWQRMWAVVMNQMFAASVWGVVANAHDAFYYAMPGARWMWLFLGVIAFANFLWMLAVRRWERVTFYNVLIDQGPQEFSYALKKRAFNPNPAKKPDLLQMLLGLTVGSGKGNPYRALDDAQVRTCPQGHPIASRTLVVKIDRTGDGPTTVLMCERCESLIPEPAASEVALDWGYFGNAKFRIEGRRATPRRKPDVHNAEA